MDKHMRNQAKRHKQDKKKAQRLGVHYTPYEVVDFINNSVKDILMDEFGVDFRDERVELSDPFCGSGRFVERMILDRGLIPDNALDDVYDNRLKANEIDTDTAKECKRNIEDAYFKRTGKRREFKHMYNCDTFAAYPEDDWGKPL